MKVYSRMVVTNRPGVVILDTIQPDWGLPMWPEFIQFLAFFLLTVGLLKIAATYLTHQNPGSALGNGLAWFVPGLA